MSPIEFRTKADLVYEALREQILSGELRPGERVRISRVARELGVSDIPAREGVKRLEADGLLGFTAHKGAVVKNMGAHEVEELFAIRAELEALALREAGRRITKPQLVKLRAILDEMAIAEQEGRAKDFGRLNREFHFLAYSAQPYRRLQTMIESLWDSTDWCRQIFAAKPDSLSTSHAEHESIYEALARGDGEAAAVFMLAQKHRAETWLLNAIAEREAATESEVA